MIALNLFQLIFHCAFINIWPSNYSKYLMDFRKKYCQKRARNKNENLSKPTTSWSALRICLYFEPRKTKYLYLNRSYSPRECFIQVLLYYRFRYVQWSKATKMYACFCFVKMCATDICCVWLWLFYYSCSFQFYFEMCIFSITQYTMRAILIRTSWTVCKQNGSVLHINVQS